MADPSMLVWPVFVLAILLVSAAGVSSALHHTGRYNTTETNALSYVADKLTRSLETSAATEAGTDTPDPRPRRLVAPADLLEGLSKTTLIADRLALIQRMRESQVKVNLSALQQLTLAREAAVKWLTVPGFTANLSMMLGLLGTVVGLTIMVQQIGLGLPQDRNQVTLDTWMASIDQIRGVLNGMRTGFIATIAGLASAILLSWLNHRLSRAQAAFLNQLDRFTTEDLLPATIPGTEDESLLEKISLQLETSFTRLDDVTRNNQETLRELSAIEKGFVDIVEAVRQTTKTETSERLHELIGRMSAVVGQLATLDKSVVNVTGTMPALVAQVSQSNQASLSRVDRLLEAYEEQRTLLHWPLQMKVVFAFMAVVNLVLVSFLIWR